METCLWSDGCHHLHAMLALKVLKVFLATTTNPPSYVPLQVMRTIIITNHSFISSPSIETLLPHNDTLGERKYKMKSKIK
jgi:hypothetical protein